MSVKKFRQIYTEMEMYAMKFDRCFHCMGTIETYPCPHCGYDPQAETVKAYALRPGTILNGKYVVGTVMGQGGFGITYVGWDLALDCKVAIKEYYPSGQVARDVTASTQLKWYSTPQSEAARDNGRELFLKEARKMTRVRDIPQVVHVHDLFQENDTAYIAMDYVEGQTLKAMLMEQGPLTWEQAKTIFLPAIRAMEEVHEAGLIHRDLSPDNLMITPSNKVRILDLGASKDLTLNSGASSMQVAKGGFSPLEQYTQRGGSGSWSDVYAMAATMYYALTGILPPFAVDRMEEDQICWDLEPLKALPEPVLGAIRNAMGVYAKKRTQTMAEFLAQLEGAEVPAKTGPEPQDQENKDEKKDTPAQKTGKNRWYIPVVALVLVAALAAGFFLLPDDWKSLLENRGETPSLSVPAETTQPPETTIPETVPPTTLPETVPMEETPLVETLPEEPDQGETQEPIEETAPVENTPTALPEKTLAVGDYHSLGLLNDGTVIATGNNQSGQCNVSEWKDIIAISAGLDHTVGLRADGTVVAIGNNGAGRCKVSGWQDIIDVSAGMNHTVGARANGKAVATGNNVYGQCEVSYWNNIVAVSAGENHSVGLRSDGTVVAAGYNDVGQCNVYDWTDIVAISAGGCHTLGLKSDGTVVAAGYQVSGRCDVKGWSDIVAVSAGKNHSVGVKADGTVVAVGDNQFGQCNVSYWRDIVAVSAGNGYTLGLTSSGTVVAAGNSYLYENWDTSGWCDLRLPDPVR